MNNMSMQYIYSIIKVNIVSVSNDQEVKLDRRQ